MLSVFCSFCLVAGHADMKHLVEQQLNILLPSAISTALSNHLRALEPSLVTSITSQHLNPLSLKCDTLDNTLVCLKASVAKMQSAMHEAQVQAETQNQDVTRVTTRLNNLAASLEGLKSEVEQHHSEHQRQISGLQSSLTKDLQVLREDVLQNMASATADKLQALKVEVNKGVEGKLGELVKAQEREQGGFGRMLTELTERVKVMTETLGESLADVHVQTRGEIEMLREELVAVTAAEAVSRGANLAAAAAAGRGGDVGGDGVYGNCGPARRTAARAAAMNRGASLAAAAGGGGGGGAGGGPGCFGSFGQYGRAAAAPAAAPATAFGLVNVPGLAAAGDAGDVGFRGLGGGVECPFCERLFDGHEQREVRGRGRQSVKL
jgi:hypothetical protein